MLIESARILIDDKLTTAHLLLEDGVIRSISKLRPSTSVELKIDASGLIALPGMIDAHVHLRDLELSYKETFETGTQSAAVGGFTTVFDMPNTRPPTASSQALMDKMSRAQGRLFVNVAFQGALVENPAEVKAMVENGAIAFKLYMNRALETFHSTDNTKLARALDAVKESNAIVTVHAENGAAIKRIQQKSENEGKTTIRDFLHGHTPRMEISAVRRILNLTRQLGLQAHVCHITTPERFALQRKRPTRHARPLHIISS